MVVAVELAVVRVDAVREYPFFNPIQKFVLLFVQKIVHFPQRFQVLLFLRHFIQPPREHHKQGAGNSVHIMTRGPPFDPPIIMRLPIVLHYKVIQLLSYSKVLLFAKHFIQLHIGVPEPYSIVPDDGHIHGIPEVPIPDKHGVFDVGRCAGFVVLVEFQPLGFSFLDSEYFVLHWDELGVVDEAGDLHVGPGLPELDVETDDGGFLD